MDAIHILHTDNETASALPARRLHALLASAKDKPFRYQRLHSPVEVGTRPDEVAAEVAAILGACPGAEWIVVANGGLKTMTLGLLHTMADPRVTVAYSEIGAGWLRVSARDGEVTTEPMPEVAAADMDLLPVASLVEAQHVADPSGIQLDIQRVQPLDTTAIARGCMTDTGWNWRAGFSALGLPGAPPGTLFEWWCGSLLLELGVTNLVSGLRVKGEGTEEAAESDLLCIHKGRFHYLELKLRDEDDEEGGTLVEIARKASVNCKTFGGASGLPCLVLPNRILREAELNLFALFHPRPAALHAPDSPRLISRLAELIGINEVPDHLREVENEIVAWVARRHLTRAFGQEHRFLRRNENTGNPLFASIRTFADTVRSERGQNWLLLMDEERVSLMVERPPNQPLPPGWSKHGTTWKISSPTTPALIEALRDSFTGFINRPVPPGELVNAWPGAVPSSGHPRPAKPPATSEPAVNMPTSAWKNTVVEGRLAPEQRGKSFRYNFQLDGTLHTVVVPVALVPPPPPDTLDIKLRGFSTGLFQGEPYP